MGKKLITKNNLDEFLGADATELVIDNSIIVSPGVKDILDEKGIALVYKNERKDYVEKKKQELVKKINKILIEEFHIEENEKLRIITKKVLEKIN